MCSKISPQACAFAYSSIQLFTRTSPPLLLPSLLRQPTNTHPFCHLDVSIRACARSASPLPPAILTLGPLDRIFQTWLESSSYLRRLGSNFLERMWWKGDVHGTLFLIKSYTSFNRGEIKNNLMEIVAKIKDFFSMLYLFFKSKVEKENKGKKKYRRKVFYKIFTRYLYWRNNIIFCDDKLD